jgi:hypothetical protein
LHLLGGLEREVEVILFLEGNDAAYHEKIFLFRFLTSVLAGCRKPFRGEFRVVASRSVRTAEI